MKHLIVLALLMPLAGHAADGDDRDGYCDAVRLMAFTAKQMADQDAIDQGSQTRDLRADRLLASQMLGYKAAAKTAAKTPGAGSDEMCDGITADDEALINKYATGKKGGKNG